MNNIISKIEINSFRSIQRLTVDVGSTNVFSGFNDVGKSNVLKALNLFFNGQTDFGSDFNFLADYSKVSLASVQRSSKKKQQIKIRLHLKAPSSFKSLQGRELWVEKVFDRFGTPSEHSSLDGTKQRSSLTRLQNSIQYFYIPALKGPDVLQYILGEVGKRRLIAESDIANLNKKVNESITGLARILTQSSISTSTKFELPVLVEDFWQKLNINTKYDEFEKLNVEINPSKKGNGDPLKEEFYQIPLQLRGEGIKSKYIPPLLQWIQEREPALQYIWGVDEPENSLEFKKAQKVADLYFGSYSKKTQLFLTSHSLAFIFPDCQYKGVKIFRCIRGELGETQIEQLDNLFTKNDRYSLAEDIGALEVQKEIIEEWRVKDEQIEKLQGKVNLLAKPIIFVEGELDEAYFKKALEINNSLDRYPADIRWIGYKDSKGNVQFTGKSCLLKAENFLIAHNPQQKIVLFFDVDCHKQVKTTGNLTVFCPKEIDGAEFKSGVEHLLVTPSGFSKDPFLTKEMNGDTTTMKPNKIAIKDHIFRLDIEEQRQWLASIYKYLQDLEKYL